MDRCFYPDAIEKGGTVEVKDVKSQSYTKQLRLQKEISNENGAIPRLIINQSAKISKPLQNAGFDIKTYQLLLTKVKDGTNIPTKPLRELPKQE